MRIPLIVLIGLLTLAAPTGAQDRESTPSPDPRLKLYNLNWSNIVDDPNAVLIKGIDTDALIEQLGIDENSIEQRTTVNGREIIFDTKKIHHPLEINAMYVAVYPNESLADEKFNLYTTVVSIAPVLRRSSADEALTMWVSRSSHLGGSLIMRVQNALIRLHWSGDSCFAEEFAAGMAEILRNDQNAAPRGKIRTPRYMEENITYQYDVNTGVSYFRIKGISREMRDDLSIIPSGTRHGIRHWVEDGALVLLRHSRRDEITFNFVDGQNLIYEKRFQIPYWEEPKRFDRGGWAGRGNAGGAARYSTANKKRQ